MDKKKYYIETYGCQMNFADSEIVASILDEHGYLFTNNKADADIVLVNTCSIRENAEQRVRNRLKELNSLRKRKPNLIIGLIGCMAERLKEQLIKEEKAIDLIVGPDAYRKLPELISISLQGNKAIDVQLSLDETYDDIPPVRYDSNGISAYISIMRGCENFCSYCVVPYTRGKERSRNPKSIISEAKALFDKGFREIILLGQNVNSYKWTIEGEQTTFADLMEQVAQANSRMRVRFATSHPKDISIELLKVIAKYPNICKSIHLPAQSGSTQVLKRMNRKYTREEYLGKIAQIRNYIPNCAISTDIISGFCGETEEEHQQTLSLMKEVAYDFAYMFKYSEREGTAAAKKFKDDVPEDLKIKRLNEIIQLQQELSFKSNQHDLNSVTEVLIDSVSKRSTLHFSGRNSQNKVVVFPASTHKIGDYVNVKIEKVSAATLLGKTIE